LAYVPKQWRLLPHDRDNIERLARSLQQHPIVAQLLLNRQIVDPSQAERFLNPSLKLLYPPEDLPGIQEAAKRVSEAISTRKSIAIYGDYDVDGVTGTSILLGLLQRLDAKVRYYVPHRLEEGYGVNCTALQSLAADGIDTVITVDCGITSVAEAIEAKRLGIDLIITDHHEMKSVLPDASILVHPQLPGSQYPFSGLSGAGVAFKLAWAIATTHTGSVKLPTPLREYLIDCVGLASMGLIADVMPLLDENRILVNYGLSRLRSRPSIGMDALMTSAGIENREQLRAEDIGFKLAPRMNAAGRLGYAGLVVEMLTTHDSKRAHDIAANLERENTHRQFLERKMVEQALEMIDGSNLETLPAAVLSHPDWHPGVIGIVAGRLVERIGRPILTIAFPEGKEFGSGSGRSIRGFPLHEALRACESDLVTHGGHSMAAGFKIHPDKLDSFRARFCEYAANHFPNRIPPVPTLTLDAELGLSALSYDLIEKIDRLEPYGCENPRPIFLAGEVQIMEEPKLMGKGEVQKHVALRVQQGSTKIRAVAFNMADRLEDLMSQQGRCSLAFRPSVNEWQGNRKIEIQIIDFKPGHQINW
jgi:single-stranded-DNA-specific exonuclease